MAASATILLLHCTDEAQLSACSLHVRHHALLYLDY